MSDCARIYSGYDNGSDGPEFEVDRRPKARKIHTCVECHKTIQVGEVYLSSTGKWDGDAKTIRTCLFSSVSAVDSPADVLRLCLACVYSLVRPDPPVVMPEIDRRGCR